LKRPVLWRGNILLIGRGKRPVPAGGVPCRSYAYFEPRSFGSTGKCGCSTRFVGGRYGSRPSHGAPDTVIAGGYVSSYLRSGPCRTSFRRNPRGLRLNSGTRDQSTARIDWLLQLGKKVRCCHSCVRINDMHDRIYDSICEVIGSTPIIPVETHPRESLGRILVKLES